MNVAEIERKLADTDRKIIQLQSLHKLQANASDNAGDYSAIQSRADAALQPHGKRAGPPLFGEPIGVYRKRLAGQVAACTEKWASFPLSGVRDDAFEAQIELQIYSDAAVAARNPIVPEGELRCIPGKTYGGHKINTYHGEPRTWMDPIAGPVRQFVKSFRGVA
jgi:hypothetical protein